jgi:hypothetical protein
MNEPEIPTEHLTQTNRFERAGVKEICEHCGGTIDRPGLFSCRKRIHPRPTLAQKIVAAIEEDLSDRRGIGQEWQSIEPELQRYIRDGWAKIVERKLRP